jgi:hypothetical protein
MWQQPPFRDYRDRLAEGQWDLIIADIPWKYHKPGANAKATHLVPYPTLEQADYPEMMRTFYAALRPDRNLWCWSDYFNLPALFSAAEGAGFTYRGLAVVRRKGVWLGRFLRHNVYFLPAWSKGKAYYNPAVAATVAQDLGAFLITRSHKPQAVYDRLVAHSLPPKGTWIDPFPATHIEEYRGPAGTTLLAPSLWLGGEVEAMHPPTQDMDAPHQIEEG